MLLIISVTIYDAVGSPLARLKPLEQSFLVLFWIISGDSFIIHNSILDWSQHCRIAELRGLDKQQQLHTANVIFTRYNNY